MTAIYIAGLAPRSEADRTAPRNKHFTGYDLECPHCGRFYASDDDPPLSAGMSCPDTDCPTYWELAGRDHPDA